MIEIKILNSICDLPIKSFAKYGTNIKNREGSLFFKNNNSKILGIAHLDTVQLPKPSYLANNLFFHPCLDDRLGVYVLLEILPRYGLQFDLLLTDGEEKGKSTARFFKPPKQYNWMFSFDRSGTDVVMYQYQEPLLERIVESHGFAIGKGSNSDITTLGHCKCKGFNFGVGYHNHHTIDAYADLNETESMIRKFIPFYNACKNTEFPH